MLPKLFSPIARKKCSSDQEKLLKFDAEGRELCAFFASIWEILKIIQNSNWEWLVASKLERSCHLIALNIPVIGKYKKESKPNDQGLKTWRNHVDYV